MKDLSRVTCVLLLVVTAFTWTAAVNVIQALEHISELQDHRLSPAKDGDAL